MKKPKKHLIYEILWRLEGLVDTTQILISPPLSRGEWIVGSETYAIRRELERRWAKKQIRNAFYYLKRSGYLIKKKISGQDRYFLTAKGIKRVIKLKVKNGHILENKYLVLIFDIPEKEKDRRNHFRQCLRELGFEQLQKSVWIVKKDVLEEIKVLLKLHQVEPYVKLIFADKVIK